MISSTLVSLSKFMNSGDVWCEYLPQFGFVVSFQFREWQVQFEDYTIINTSK